MNRFINLVLFSSRNFSCSLLFISSAHDNLPVNHSQDLNNPNFSCAFVVLSSCFSVLSSRFISHLFDYQGCQCFYLDFNGLIYPFDISFHIAVNR